MTRAWPKSELPAWLPNASLSRFVFARPHLWHLQDNGSAASAQERPLLLFLHGAGASVHSWRALLPALAPDYHVVALDLPGQGLSELGDRHRCSLTAMAEDMATLLHQENLAPDLIISHSAGSAIALQLILNGAAAPKAVLAINPALADFAGDAGTVFPFLAKLLTMNPLTPLALSLAGSNASLVQRTLKGTGSDIDDAGLRGYRALFSSQAHVSATMRMMASWSLKPLRERLDEIEVPLLFLVGDNDKAVPPAATIELARTLKTAEVEQVPMAGHLLHEEQPQLICARIRRFVSRSLA